MTDAARDIRGGAKTLVITCCDLVEGLFAYTIGQNLHTATSKDAFGRAVANHLDIDDYILVSSPDSLDVMGPYRPSATAIRSAKLYTDICYSD